MKELKKEIKVTLRDLKQLTKKTERLATKLEKLEAASKAKPKAKAAAKPKSKAKAAAKPKSKAKAAAKPKAKKTAKKAPAVKKPPKKTPAKADKKMTASDTVLNLIKNSKTPIDTATLKAKTGFKDNNIRMIVYRLKKRGEIKSVRKGVYEKA